MSALFPRVYRSFEDFERNELTKLDLLYTSIDALVDEMLKAELEDLVASGRKQDETAELTVVADNRCP